MLHTPASPSGSVGSLKRDKEETDFDFDHDEGFIIPLQMYSNTGSRMRNTALTPPSRRKFPWMWTMLVFLTLISIAFAFWSELLKAFPTITIHSNIANHERQSGVFPIQPVASASRRGSGAPVAVVVDTRESAGEQQQTKMTTEAAAFPPPKLSGIPLHAAQALACRQSVINFVINATDGKDECEGLKKAFERTCSNDGYEDSDSQDKAGRRKHRNMSEKLWDKSIPKVDRWHESVFYLSQTLRRIGDWLMWKEPAPFFLAEDEVATDETWQTARFLVKEDLDRVVYRDILHSWATLDCQIRPELCQARVRRKLDESIESSFANDGNKEVQHLNHTHSGGGLSLDLPFASGHVSEKVMGEALMLQQGDKLIEKATNHTSTNAAKSEAAASSKAVSDASAAVSAVLNDPSSIEARTCCASILNVYHDNCSTDVDDQVSDSRLFFVVFVMALCGMVKSLIRHFKILWLPEAAGCIIVGVLSGYGMLLLPHHDISFDGNWFLRILVPPIIFEAAISIDKRAFNRHIVPILIYAVAGTLVATVLTASILHRGTTMLSDWCYPIPYVEALAFGALISSIDPIAVLSVLSNMGMTDTDTIYVVIFGESLLNDGVAIVLFHTLVHFLDETLVIDRAAVIAAVIHFVVVAFGSFLIGVASGMLCTVYYWIFHGCQTPLVEVLMFFCWALLPYYVCDGIGWSGIVSVVAAGFVMDLYIVGDEHGESEIGDTREPSPKVESARKRGQIFSPMGQLSNEAKTHIGFVTEIISTMMETAIFAYLGLFLFSHRYHWNIWHTLISITACCLSRGIMIPCLSWVANFILRMQQNRPSCRMQQSAGRKSPQSAGVVIDKKMQLVLWFAGLRGAMSFALVEHIPLYDEVSGIGTRLKPELKAMTSACIMFTVFVLGGRTYHMMEYLGIAPSASARKQQQNPSPLELTALMTSKSYEDSMEIEDDSSRTPSRPGHVFRRQRHKEPMPEGE
jgi:NhaP-type Na+/H+ or K+/H+ antiporter